MEKIIKKIAATSMVALAALFMTTSFASCSSDDDDIPSPKQEEQSGHYNSKIHKFYTNYDYKFTADFLKVADVTFTYTDSLGQEKTDEIKMTNQNAEVGEYEKNIVYSKVPLTVAYKLTIKMKDKKDIPVQSVYELGWSDTSNEVVPCRNDGTKVAALVKSLSQYKMYGPSSTSCKKVSYAELEDAFKNAKDGFENFGTTRKNIYVTEYSVGIFRNK